MNIEQVNAALRAEWERWDSLTDEELHEEFIHDLYEREEEYYHNPW